MIILGINDTHDASACLIIDGELIVAIAEERFQRIKGMGGFPHNAINNCIEYANIATSDIDYVAIASEGLVPNNIHNIVASFSIKDYFRWEEEYYFPIIYKNEKIKLKDVFTNYAPKGDLSYPINEIPFITSNELSNNVMEDIKTMRMNYVSNYLGINKSRIYFYNHHRCHAYYGYYINPNKYNKMVVVTADAGGDNAYNSIYEVNNGIFTKLVESRNNIIGKVYSAITLLLGMKPDEHEFKVMGLAPYASEYQKKEARGIFLSTLKVKDIDFVRSKELKDYFHYFKERLKTCRFDGIAGGIQDFAEIRLSEWFKNIVRKTGISDVVYSGGIANNVKANKSIIELDCINSLFVPPGPGDESLSIGSAFCFIYDNLGAKKALDYIKPIDNAFWGYEVCEIDHAKFREHKFIKNNYTSNNKFKIKDIAELIAKGEIIALCHSKMEFGSRALGHRSLVADPSNPESVRKLNDLIKKRDFWMPFTPSILNECFDDYIVNNKNIDSSYMTITHDSKELAKIHLIGAIHPYDYTIRPQRVFKEISPFYYKLINEFKKISGIGAVLNTSLNIHGKPIVMNPTDILNEILLDGNIPLKYILIEDTFYKKI